MRGKPIFRRVLVVVLLLLTLSASHTATPSSTTQSDNALFETALRWILSPASNTVRHDYVMTAKVRLLLFWVGADDVGGGYIRKSSGSSPEQEQFIQVLFGSDPARAPRRINYWGAATERSNRESTALLGFMKAGKTDSASDAEAEIQKQAATGQHPFEAILSIVRKDRALSRRTPLVAGTDLNLNQLDLAQNLAIERLASNPRVRELGASDLQCAVPRGFLQAVDELIGEALTAQAAPRSFCYVHNARNYTLTLQKRSKVASHSFKIQRKNGTRLERTYRDLLETNFSVLNHASREKTGFQVLAGTSGPLRGVPVQIVHQPNWWFRVVLNLEGNSIQP